MWEIPVIRPALEQQVFEFTRTANTTAVQVDPTGSLSQYITSMVLSVPTGQAQSAFLSMDQARAGGQAGIELPVGIPLEVGIDQTRQLYEVQEPVWKIWIRWLCKDDQPVSIPVVAFDLSHWWLGASAATTVNITAFPEAYV